MLRSKLATLREYRQSLAEWLAESLQEFVGDPKRTAAARYAYQTIMECARDINDELLARQAGVSARSHEDAFQRMAAQGMLPLELAERFREHCRLRNRIVHQYNEVRDDQFHAAGKRLVADAEEYAQHIARVIGL
jgi:uncharacterized protein YutE (UPF0331/DUF86 family)